MLQAPARQRVARIFVTVVAVAIGLIGAMSVPANAAKTTITSSVYPGNVVRDDSISLTTHPVARMFSRNTATGSWSVTSPLVAGGGAGATFACRGDTGAIGTAGANNNSPRTNLAITGPAALLNATSPVIDTSIGGAIGGYPPFATQPVPSGTNYRGGASAGGTAGNAAFANGTDSRAWNNTVSLAGKPAGLYTATTTTRNMTKSPITTGACTIGTPNIPVPNAAAPTAGLQTEALVFEYRPWQHVFKDVFGGGKVNMNIRPQEFQAVVDGNTGSIYDGGISGGGYMKFYEVGDPSSFMLPSDPAACAADPTSCLPSGARQCDPALSSTCDPRVVVINKPAPGDMLRGVFDLKTKAFIALANVNGHQRLLLSLGTDQDAGYQALLAQLYAAAAAQGIDLPHLLATKVRVRVRGTEISLSLLNGLQIQPTSGKNGIQIVSDATVQAGLILNVYAALGGPVCAVNKGDSSPTTAAPDRYTHGGDAGYTVEKSDLLPDVPRVGVVGALVGGPIYHIEGDFVGTAPTLVNTSVAVIGLDTAADEPNGYPIWIEPFVSTPAHTTVARKMDFLGTATWSASETPVTGVGCLTVDFMLGAGVALYNNPLPVGFGDIPVWDPQDPAVRSLMDQINGAVQGVVDQVAGNPTVANVLQMILDALP